MGVGRIRKVKYDLVGKSLTEVRQDEVKEDKLQWDVKQEVKEEGRGRGKENIADSEC